MTSISRNTALRLIKDIRNLKKNPLHDNGIYYEHDEEDMLNGKALIIGPTNTPYQYGFYFFKFEFTNNYPHEPPKLTSYTQGDNVRFHPNLYRSGKVCVSILNTWKGEQWSSCQTISTILLTLTSLLHNKPLLNEPGITESHYDFDRYNNIITFKNLEYGIINIFDNLYKQTSSKYDDFDCFKETVCNILKKNIGDILILVKTLEKNNKGRQNIKTTLYNMSCEINYKEILKKMKIIQSDLKELNNKN